MSTFVEMRQAVAVTTDATELSAAAPKITTGQAEPEILLEITVPAVGETCGSEGKRIRRHQHVVRDPFLAAMSDRLLR